MIAQYEQNKKDSNRYGKVDWEKPRGPQTYTMNYRQPRNSGAEEIVTPRIKHTNFIVQYQIISPENIHTGKTIKT